MASLIQGYRDVLLHNAWPHWGRLSAIAALSLVVLAPAVTLILILIDEVLGVGDEEFRAKSTQAMRERIRSDKTIVLVSHSPGTIRELCDRAVWIEEGVTRAVGEVGEVTDAYHAEIARRQRVSESLVRSTG